MNDNEKGKLAVREGKGSAQTTAVCGTSWTITKGSSSQPILLLPEQQWAGVMLRVPGLAHGTDVCQLSGVTGIIRETECPPFGDHSD